MTNDQITELAKQAGAARFYPERQAVTPDAYLVGQDFLQRFAELWRNEVLEEAAKQCDEAMEGIWKFHPEYVNEVGRNCCTNLAKRIRGLKS